MYSINIHANIVMKSELVNASELLAHELVVEDRLQTLVQYLSALNPLITIPSVLVCHKTKMIIDGHHRYFALQQLGFKKIPVTWINYGSEDIITDETNSIDKQILIDAALNNQPLPPKTSCHHILDIQKEKHPIILLSVLFQLQN